MNQDNIQTELEKLTYEINPYENTVDEKKFLFIDLCSGMGGFHQAIHNIKEIDSQLLFAADIEKNCREVYEKNYGVMPYDDLTKINVFKHKKFNAIFAGFPCQPFSVAGKRMGLDDARGTIIHYILNMVKHRKPEVVCLENVKGLKSLKNKDQCGSEVMCYKLIYSVFEELGYFITDRVISPDEINIPQKRERVVIVATRKDAVKNKNIKTNEDYEKTILHTVGELINLRKKQNENKQIFDNDKDVHPRFKLNATLNNYPKEEIKKNEEKIKQHIESYNKKDKTLTLWNKIISDKGWDKLDNNELQTTYTLHTKKKCKKNFKQEHLFIDFLHYKDTTEIPKNLNCVDRRNKNICKTFKDKSDMWNLLYQHHEGFQKFWDEISKKYANEFLDTPLQHRYLEYSGNKDYGSKNTLNDKYCQFRMSGVRIRRGEVFPTLVKSGPMPIIISKRRYLTNSEGARLQSFPGTFQFIGGDSKAMNRIGNAVNVEVIEIMLRSMLMQVFPEKFNTHFELSQTNIIKEDEVKQQSNNVTEITEEDEVEQQPDNICSFILKRGKNKGKQCGKKNCKSKTHKKEN